jgi:integrase
MAKVINRLDGKNLWKIEARKPPQKEYWFRDRPRLSFVVRNEGKSRRWVYSYTWNSEPKRIEIGTLAEVTLATARDLCEKYDKWRKAGKDPKDAREKEASAAKNENVRVQVYIDQVKKAKQANRSATKDHVRYWDEIEKKVGHRRAIDIDRNDLREIFDIENRHYATPWACKALCGHLKSIFALVHDDFPTKVPANAGARLTSGFQPIKDMRKVKHAPPWPLEDHAPFILKCRNHISHIRGGGGTRPDVSLLTECLFLIGTRPQEPREALWKEIDWDNLIWNIPFTHRKTGGLLDGHDRPIPITPSVEKILLEMKKRYPDAKKTDVIFPAARKRKPGKPPSMSDDTIYLHMHDSLCWHRKLNPNSARNGFVRWARTNKIYIPYIERQLDHTMKEDQMAADLRGPYEQQEMYMKARTIMMTAFDKHCNGIDEPVSQEITTSPIRSLVA